MTRASLLILVVYATVGVSAVRPGHTDETRLNSASKFETTGIVRVNVATLNALAKAKTSRSPASFPTVTDTTIEKKRNGWLTGVLNRLWSQGYDIVAIQESDPTDADASNFDCSTTWKYAGGDPQHLCYNSAKVQFADEDNENCGDDTYAQQTGITTCNFILTADPSKRLRVMAGHASPSFGGMVQAYPAVLDYRPDIILMDANQAQSLAMKAMPEGYSVFPATDDYMTTVKSEFKYRKLYQAFEGTCAISRKCTPGEQGFYLLPDELNTCGKLLASGQCGAMDGKASEGMWKEKPEVCKYASRVCGTWEPKYTGEMNQFLQTHPSVASRADFDLKHIQGLLWGDSGPTAMDTETEQKQEDLIVYKSDFELKWSEVQPGTTNSAFMAKGAEDGFPNELWPSDHFLVSAQLSV